MTAEKFPALHCWQAPAVVQKEPAAQWVWADPAENTQGLHVDVVVSQNGFAGFPHCRSDRQSIGAHVPAELQVWSPGQSVSEMHWTQVLDPTLLTKMTLQKGVG